MGFWFRLRPTLGVFEKSPGRLGGVRLNRGGSRRVLDWCCAISGFLLLAAVGVSGGGGAGGLSLGISSPLQVRRNLSFFSFLFVLVCSFWLHVLSLVLVVFSSLRRSCSVSGSLGSPLAGLVFFRLT